MFASEYQAGPKFHMATAPSVAIAMPKAPSASAWRIGCEGARRAVM